VPPGRLPSEKPPGVKIGQAALALGLGRIRGEQFLAAVALVFSTYDFVPRGKAMFVSMQLLPTRW
jgi:hypothetical protein